MEYLERLNAEEILKNRLIDTLEQKKKQIQQKFTEYVHESEQDQLQFLRWTREVKELKGNPEAGVADFYCKVSH